MDPCKALMLNCTGQVILAFTGYRKDFVAMTTKRSDVFGFIQHSYLFRDDVGMLAK